MSGDPRSAPSASGDLVASCTAAIQTEGYCRLRRVYSSRQVGRALALVRALAATGLPPPDLPPLAGAAPMIFNLQNKDEFFVELLFACEPGRRLLRRFLNDPWYAAIPSEDPNYILRGYVARTRGALPLHIDSFFPYRGPEVISLQYAIVLEAMTRQTGATLVVPGSHRAGEYAPQTARAAATPIEAEPGDLVIWDSRLWHGADAGSTGASRWILIATFTRWWIKQAFDICGSLPPRIYRTLTPSQKAVLGYCSTPRRTEHDGVNQKRGYDTLPAE